MAKTGSKSESREARLAKALRANLRRRKAQSRGRDEDRPDDEKGELADGADKDETSS